MQQGSGIILIVVGLLVIFIVVTGKYAIFEEFFYKLFNLTPHISESIGSAQGNVGSVSGATGISEKQRAIQDAIESARRSVITPVGGIRGTIKY